MVVGREDILIRTVLRGKKVGDRQISEKAVSSEMFWKVPTVVNAKDILHSCVSKLFGVFYGDRR